MKKVLLSICLCLCVFILFGCSSNTPATPTEAPTATPTEAPSTVSVDITPENFKKYFTISLEKSNEKQENSLSYMGMNWYDFSCDLTLSINSKFPCEFHNVEFSITAEGGASRDGLVGKEKNVTFTGTIPQNGVYTTKKEVKIDVTGDILDGITYSEYALKIDKASGFIVLDARDVESIK